jgi:hypothetical protein
LRQLSLVGLDDAAHGDLGPRLHNVLGSVLDDLGPALREIDPLNPSLRGTGHGEGVVRDRCSGIPGEAHLHGSDSEGLFPDAESKPEAGVVVLREEVLAAGADDVQIREREERELEPGNRPGSERDGFRSKNRRRVPVIRPS